MTNSVKDRITADLEKAKAEGNLRADRIREIVKASVAQAVAEVKAGSGEIRLIARDALAAVVNLLKEKGHESKEAVTASVEGVVEGITASRQATIAQAQSQLDHLQGQIDAHEQTLEADVDGALTEIETTARTTSHKTQSWVEAAAKSIRESQQFAVVREQYARLQSQLNQLDTQLTERYGDRYEEVKHQLEQYLESVKTWYDQTKAKVEAGAPDPVQTAKADWEERLAEAGTAVARKEQEVKQHLKTFLHPDKQRQ
ncbi:hypothetical protein [Pantanalinema sp. GBBB05]|uniref:hypothetical protein n=1 Tax=Pantanalinema sp. GBBB05 TaxID=2604139 RepID=UPI001DBEC9AB|nr:histidine kinase [Pantanalinema sp. GBBB05]